MDGWMAAEFALGFSQGVDPKVRGQIQGLQPLSRRAAGGNEALLCRLIDVGVL